MRPSADLLGELDDDSLRAADDKAGSCPRSAPQRVLDGRESSRRWTSLTEACFSNRVTVWRAATTRFNLIDEFAYLADAVGSFVAMHFEVALDGAVDVETLRGAVHRALMLHPFARARMRAGRLRDRFWEWDITPEPDVDAVVAGVHTDLREVRHRALHEHVPLETSPPLRVWIVREGGRDTLVFAVNHTPIDALAFSRIVLSIARAYTGQDDPVPDVDPLAARDISALLGMPPVSRGRALAAIARLARHPDGPPARIVPVGATRQRAVGALVESIAIVDASARPFSVTDVLVAALHRAIDVWNLRHGKESARIATYVPANLRPREWRNEIVGNYSLAASVSTLAAERTTVADLLRTMRTRMDSVRDLSAARELAPAMFGMTGLPMWARTAVPLLRPLAGRTLDTAVLTNVGHVDAIDFGPAGRATALWGSSPIRMPTGAGIMTHGLGDRLFLGLRYGRQQFDGPAARGFLAGFVDAIGEVVHAARHLR